MSDLPDRIRLQRPRAPDADYETLRDRMMEVISAVGGETWTDHNTSDPGITLLEAMVWGVADLHYRTERREMTSWPMAVPGWLDEGRHWSGTPFPDDAGSSSSPGWDMAALVALADLLAQPAPGGTVAEVVAAEVERARGSADALGRVMDREWIASDGSAVRLTPEQARAAIRLLRRRVMRRHAHDGSGRVAEVWEEVRNAHPTASAASVDAEVWDVLRHDSAFDALWDDEIHALVRRQRRWSLVESIRDLERTITRQLADAADTAALRAELQAEGLQESEAHQALARHPCPPGMLPEEWEQAEGDTRVWPPHPLQALTCEPATADDYANLARRVSGVHRSWAVPGVLPGVGWDGRPVSAADDRPGAITLLVERMDHGGAEEPVEPDEDFLRRVLREALTQPPLSTFVDRPDDDPEVDDPHATWHADRVNPRRLLCDEVGAALLQQCRVVLRGTLYATLGADRDELIENARGRVMAFFAQGRPEAQDDGPDTPTCPGGISGPWPHTPQPAGGWIPGDAIRITELVQVIADDPGVLGVEGLQLSLEDGPFLPATEDTRDDVPLPPNCVPVLDDRDCLKVKLALGAECGYA